MITFKAMLRSRFPGDPFVLGVALVALLATAFAISPSSYGIVLRQLGAAEDGVLLGEPRPIRSDEYALWTPMLQAAAAGGYAEDDPSSLYGESRRHLYPLPLNDWGLAFKPTFWLFLVLPAPYAYAGYFAAYTFLFLAGYHLLGRRFGLAKAPAALAALLLYYSAYTQTWWTSLGHHLAIFPWLLLIYLAEELRPAARAGLATLATAAWFLAGTFYPPLVWTLLLAGLLGLWVFRPETLRLAPELRARQAAMLLGLFAGAVVAFLYLREPIAAALASSGHGSRHEGGGHVPWQDFLGLFFPLFSYQGSIIVSGTNHCEASAGGSILWPLLLFFLDWSATRRAFREHAERPFLARRLAALGAAFALVAGWMLLPLPAWLGLPFLWNKFPNSRLLFLAGLLCLWLALIVFRFARFRFGPARLALFCAAIALAWWPTRIPATFEWLASGHFREVLRIEWRDHANSDLFPALLLPALATLAWLLRRKESFAGWVGPTGALAVAALANFYFFFGFNPWMSAKKIFEPPETPRLERLSELQQAHPRGWLVVGGYEHLGRTLNGLGFRSANHGFIVPETRVLRQLFPHLGDAAFDYAFNRYCLVQVALFRPGGHERLREPFFQGGDLTLVPADAYLPETRIELRVGSPAAPLPQRGEILGLRLAGHRLHLSFAGEVGGTAGSTEVTIHLDRPGRIADRWLRPRGDTFDLDQGLRLFSRLDLEIDLDVAPASLAELGLCIETRDPGFGDFAIAPTGAARSICP